MISKVVNRDIDTVFDWYYHSENFTASPIVFKSKWREPKYWEKGAIRDIVMIARWYNEEITKVVTGKKIDYRINQSFPPVQQDFTEIFFESIHDNKTKVTWIIDIEVPASFMTKPMTAFGGFMAKNLYGTIMNASKRKLETSAH